MSNTDKYLVSLAGLSGVGNVIFAMSNKDDLAFGVSINIIVYLVVTMLCVNLPPRVKRVLMGMGGGLFGIFLVTVTVKVMEIVGR